MFSLLTPAALWLAPLLAAPLLIQLLGRAKPKVRDFPSLMPVRETLRRAMRRHRLKNWLQLILRTLALLCLLLGAAGPVWRSEDTWSPPASAGMLLHNGAFAGLRDDAGETLESRLGALRTGLDSLTQGRAMAAPLFPDAEGRVARFGRPAEAMARLFQGLGEGAHAFVPVFGAQDLADLAAAARPWLESHPRARLAVLDFTAASHRLNAFGMPVTPVTPVANGSRDDALTLRAELREGASALFTPVDGAPRALEPRGGFVETALPLPDAGWVAGTFALAENDPARDPARATRAFTEVAVAWRVPPPATLCHVGSGEAFASLASLGAGGKRLKVVALRPAEAAAARCDLLYLADPPDLDAAMLARAAAVLRAGGKVILEAGRRTDPALWNRNLLAPLGVGRLTGPVITAEAEEARPDAGALARLGVRADRWGRPGPVKTRLGFTASKGTATLLSNSGPQSAPLLVHRFIGDGELLLWTTSLSDPAWSALGLGPWAALMHQAMLERAWADAVDARGTETDSLVFLASRDGGDGEVRVTRPDGSPFTRLRGEPGGVTAGPFDLPGLYRVERDGALEWLAVRVPDPPAREPDWKAFREVVGADAGHRVARLEPDEDWRGLYGGYRLRTVLFVVAALLLFAEGIVSLRLTPSRD